MVALTPRCAEEMGYEIPPEDAKKPYVEVSGRKGQGVKADDLIDQLEASAAEEKWMSAIPNRPDGRTRRDRRTPSPSARCAIFCCASRARR